MGGGVPRPHTSDLMVGAASDADQGLQFADGPNTWDWGEAPEIGLKVGVAANNASRGSTSSSSPRLQQEGSWFDQDAWSRIKADRTLRKAAQREAQEEQWRVAVRPWLIQKKVDSRETEVQKRLTRAREEQSQLLRRLDEKKRAMRHAAHALLKDMRSLLTSDALTEMSPKQAKILDRWVDDMMLRHEFSQNLMDQVEHMHESLIRQLFESIDRDDSGLLDKDEVRQLASTLGAYRPLIAKLHLQVVWPGSCQRLASFRRCTRSVLLYI